MSGAVIDLLQDAAILILAVSGIIAARTSDALRRRISRLEADRFWLGDHR